MKDTIAGFLGIMVTITFFGLYFLGIYSVVRDDHRYTTKDVVIAAVIFPYAIYVGGETIYRVITTSSEDRAQEKTCLDTAEAIGLKRKLRLRYCECMIESRDEDKCRVKILGQ